VAENASLGDYLFELRRRAAPARLDAGIGAGTLLAALGLFLGPRFAAVSGLGLAVAGVCAWARINQVADSKMDASFGAEPPARGRPLRALGVVALGVAAVGTLIFFYSLASRFVHGATGL